MLGSFIKTKSFGFINLGDSSYIAAALELFLATPFLLKKIERLKRNTLTIEQQKFLKLLDDLSGEQDLTKSWADFVNVVEEYMFKRGPGFFYKDEVYAYQFFNDCLEIKPTIQYQQVTRYSAHDKMPVQSFFKKIGMPLRVLTLNAGQSLESLIAEEKKFCISYHPIANSEKSRSVPTVISQRYLIPEEQSTLLIQVGQVLTNISVNEFKIDRLLNYIHPQHQTKSTYFLHGLTLFSSGCELTEYISLIKSEQGWVYSQNDHVREMTENEVEHLLSNSSYIPSLLMYVNSNLWDIEQIYSKDYLLWVRNTHFTIFHLEEIDILGEVDAINSKNIFQQELSAVVEPIAPVFSLDALADSSEVERDNNFEQIILTEVFDIKEKLNLLSIQSDASLLEEQSERLEKSINQHCELLESKARNNLFFSCDPFVEKTMNSLKELNLLKETALKMKEGFKA